MPIVFGIMDSDCDCKEVDMRLGPLGLPELLIILAVLLLIFGARRLPEIGSSLGKGLRMFKSSVTGDEEKEVERPAEEQKQLTNTANSSRSTDDLV
jgi:sec-independent protein translocase protein TatA